MIGCDARPGYPLTALYVEIDDHVIPSGRRGAGQPKKLSDAELVCLAVAQVLLGARSERHWLRMCYARLGHLFPYLPKQPGYHKRLKAAGPLLAAAMDRLARQSPSWHDQVRLTGATPVPCGAPGRPSSGPSWRGPARVLRRAFALDRPGPADSRRTAGRRGRRAGEPA